MRQPQPYRKGARPAGPSLASMLLGKPKYMPHPKDALRAAQKRANRGFTGGFHSRGR